MKSVVNWYKHDIPAWMDGTASLSSNAYRAYHVICQMLYLSEEPIALNERFLAGACNQSVRAFQASLSELVEAKKLTIESGKISNSRVAAEIFRVEKNRENARKGGEKSGEVREVVKKPNKNKGDDEAPLQHNLSLLEKTREDETRREKKESPSGLSREKKSRPRTAFPRDAQISVAQIGHAKERGIAPGRIESIFQKFKDYHISRGNLMADWEAAWRTWIGNQVERFSPPPQNQESWVRGDDFG